MFYGIKLVRVQVRTPVYVRIYHRGCGVCCIGISVVLLQGKTISWYDIAV
jgi:hypothetical protein